MGLTDQLLLVAFYILLWYIEAMLSLKHFLEKHKNTILGTSILVTGIVLGVGITTYYPLLSNSVGAKPQPTPVKTIDETEEKKQALTSFYKQLSTAQDNKDWITIYALAPQSVRDNVTKDQFVSWNKRRDEKDKAVSQQTTVNSIEITGDKGIVDRTRITCFDKNCTGNNRKEENLKKEYVYINGKWQIPDLQPSERALKVATFTYYNESQSDQKAFVEGWGYGSNNEHFAIKQYANSLDQDLTLLVSEETNIEKFKTEQANKPKVIYQQTPVYIPAPVNNSPQIIQQPNSMHCTSNRIGDYTYTNCY